LPAFRPVLRAALGTLAVTLSVLSCLAPAGVRAQAAATPAAASVAAPPATASHLDAILARGALRVGTTGDYKPFSYRVGQTDKVIGLDLELAADLARSLGVGLEIVPTTWGTLMPDLLADRFDLAMGGVSVTLERQRHAMFSLAYLRDGKTPIARCADVGKYQTVAQINQPGVRLVVNPGGTNERFARANAPKAALAVWPDNVTIFDRIVSNDADVMITDAIEARLQARLHPQLCAIHPETPFDFSEKAVLLPRDAVLKAYVDQWLHQAIESGAFRRAHERWLDYPWGIETLRQSIEMRLQLAPDVARWKWNHHADIEDPARERAVLDAVVAQATALGVPRRFADAFFRAQIEASKTVQREMFMGWNVMKTGTITDVPDLQTVTRGRIDAVTQRMVHALASNWPLLVDPDRHAEVARALRPIDAESLSLKAVDQALAPLLDMKATVGVDDEPGPVVAEAQAAASAAASATVAVAMPAMPAMSAVPAVPAVPAPSDATAPAVAVAAASAPSSSATAPRPYSHGVVAALNLLTARGPKPPAAGPSSPPAQRITNVVRTPAASGPVRAVTKVATAASHADPVAELSAHPPAAGASAAAAKASAAVPARAASVPAPARPVASVPAPARPAASMPTPARPPASAASITSHTH
jgi:chorismate mutase-like protein